ncbi:MAG: TetR family transcriptional regulator [Pseudohongiellaceae bacterium]
MRRTEDEAQQTRRDILDAALSAFSSKGYAATRLEEVAEKAKVTRGAVYHHFVSKSDLYLAVIEDAEKDAQQAINLAIAGGGSFTEILERILLTSFDLLESDTRFRKAFVLTQETQRLKPIKMRGRQQAVGLVKAIAGYMEQGMAQGQIRSDADPANLARAFLAYQNGLIELWLANPKAFSIKQQASAFADLLLNGFASRD